MKRSLLTLLLSTLVGCSAFSTTPANTTDAGNCKREEPYFCQYHEWLDDDGGVIDSGIVRDHKGYMLDGGCDGLEFLIIVPCDHD